MFKRGITFGELLTASIVVLGAILGFWINTSVRLKALELSQEIYHQNQETISTDNKASFREISIKLDKLNDGQNEIKVTLQNKQDRKN